jgi:hypothetical protein
MSSKPKTIITIGIDNNLTIKFTIEESNESGRSTIRDELLTNAHVPNFSSCPRPILWKLDTETVIKAAISDLSVQDTDMFELTTAGVTFIINETSSCQLTDAVPTISTRSPPPKKVKVEPKPPSPPNASPYQSVQIRGELSI